MYVMNDFQKYLDESLPKIKFSELTDSEYRMPTQDIYIEIQQMILRERKKQKMTQKELAKRTGISQANISKIENGETHPTVDSLKKIAEAFGKRLLISFEESEDLEI